MSDRDMSHDDVFGSESTPEELQEFIEAARMEAPQRDLAERLLETLNYRRSLAGAPTASKPRFNPRHVALVASASALALAAGVWLWLHSAQRKSTADIAPEPAAGQKAPSVASSERNPSVPDPCAHRLVASGHQPLIDDFEDGDDTVLPLEGRVGQWRWARDTDAPGTAPALLPIPRPGARASNRMAIHVKGGHLQDWGAIVEFTFNPSCYDASVYQGLSFQAKGPGRIFVAPRQVDTIPVAEGGTCVKDNKECYNPHVKKIELDAEWKTYRVAFSEVEQRGYGQPAFNPQQLHSIAFLIRAEDTPVRSLVGQRQFRKALGHVIHSRGHTRWLGKDVSRASAQCVIHSLTQCHLRL